MGVSASATLRAQERELRTEDILIHVDPPKLTLNVDDQAELVARVTDVGGRPVEARVFFFSRAPRSLSVGSRDGKVLARKHGNCEIVARVSRRDGGPSVIIPVTVLTPEAVAVKFTTAPKTMHVGTTAPLAAAIVDAKGRPREDLSPEVTIVNAGVHFQLVVEALDSAGGNGASSTEPVEEELSVAA